MKKMKFDIQYFASGPTAKYEVSYKANGHPYVTSVSVVVKTMPKFSGGNIPSGWVMVNDYEMKKTYTSNVVDTVTFYMQSGEGSSSVFPDTTTITIDQIGTLNTREESYAYCGSKCKHPVYTKENFAEIVCKVTIPKNTTSNERYGYSSVAYPDGFNCFNSHLISVLVDSNRSEPFVEENVSYHEELVRNTSEGISVHECRVSMRDLITLSSEPDYDINHFLVIGGFNMKGEARSYTVKILLMKID